MRISANKNLYWIRVHLRSFAAPFLPNLAKYLSAHTLFPRGLAGHDPARRGENINAEAPEHGRNRLTADIHAAAGTRDALQTRNHRHVPRGVLQVNADKALGALFGQLVVEDVAFFFQNERNL